MFGLRLGPHPAAVSAAVFAAVFAFAFADSAHRPSRARTLASPAIAASISGSRSCPQNIASP